MSLDGDGIRTHASLVKQGTTGNLGVHEDALTENYTLTTPYKHCDNTVITP
jgi:hypothetical protein